MHEWLAEHGEPKLDLTDTTRADLNAYRESRAAFVQQQSWKTDADCLSGFFRYATETGWMDTDPVSRWAAVAAVSQRRATWCQPHLPAVQAHIQRIDDFLDSGRGHPALQDDLRAQRTLYSRVIADIRFGGQQEEA